MSQSNNDKSSTWDKAVQLTTLDTSIAAGTPVACNDHYTEYISTTLLSSDRVLVCYRNYTNNCLYSLVLTISGTSITVGTPVACNSHSSDYISTTLLSSDRVLVCYRNNTNSYYLYSLVITG